MDNLVANGGECGLFDSNCICEGTLTSSQYSVMMGDHVGDGRMLCDSVTLCATRKNRELAMTAWLCARLKTQPVSIAESGRGWSMSDMSAHYWAQKK